MKIGVVSDTHIDRSDDSLPTELLRRLEGVSAILHAGDILIPEVLEQLAKLAPVEAVAGNCDSADVVARLGEEKVVSLGGLRIGMWHGCSGHGGVPEQAVRHWAGRDVDVIVFGHSHMPLADWRGGRLLLNPGSPTEPRRAPYPSFAILRINEDEPGAAAEIVALPDR